jgi:transcriptional regulator with XRE-family HTH domain
MKLTLGERIALLRKRKGLSQAELAKLTGLNADMIDHYEYDAKKIYAGNLISIADALNVSLDYLTGRINDPVEIVNLKRVVDIQNLPDFPKECAYRTMDAMINSVKLDEMYKDIQA